jgi:hypothetical protein
VISATSFFALADKAICLSPFYLPDNVLRIRVARSEAEPPHNSVLNYGLFSRRTKSNDFGITSPNILLIDSDLTAVSANQKAL